jgi:hypothetical protein
MVGNVTFTPLSSSEGTAKRPGSGQFGPDGNFVVGSYQRGDGLMPGTYNVSVSCFNPNDSTKAPEDLNYVPASFETENLVVEVGMDPIVLNLDVPKKE